MGEKGVVENLINHLDNTDDGQIKKCGQYIYRVGGIYYKNCHSGCCEEYMSKVQLEEYLDDDWEITQ